MQQSIQLIQAILGVLGHLNSGSGNITEVPNLTKEFMVEKFEFKFNRYLKD